MQRLKCSRNTVIELGACRSHCKPSGHASSSKLDTTNHRVQMIGEEISPLRLAEMFFDPQSHTSRGVPFETFLGGFHSAMKVTVILSCHAIPIGASGSCHYSSASQLGRQQAIWNCAFAKLRSTQICSELPPNVQTRDGSGRNMRCRMRKRGTASART